MKKVKTVYWILTILLSAFVLLTGITQSTSAQGSIEIMNILKFPLYFLPFLGIAKIAGVIAILIPNFPRVKEWAYAGLMFDFSGALYAMIAVGGTIDKWGFMIVPILLCAFSYLYYHKLQQLKLSIESAK